MLGRVPDDPLREHEESLQQSVFKDYPVWSEHKILDIPMTVSGYIKYVKGNCYFPRVNSQVVFEYLCNGEIKEHRITCARLDKRR